MRLERYPLRFFILNSGAIVFSSAQVIVILVGSFDSNIRWSNGAPGPYLFPVCSMLAAQLILMCLLSANTWSNPTLVL